MSRAQGEYCGPARDVESAARENVPDWGVLNASLAQSFAASTAHLDAEEQYAGGDAAVAAGTIELARRTAAFAGYRTAVAGAGLHEVWTRVGGRWTLTHYRTDTTGQVMSRPDLAQLRRAALRY